MEKRFFQFLLWSVIILLGSQQLSLMIWPPKPEEVAQGEQGQAEQGQAEQGQAEQGQAEKGQAEKGDPQPGDPPEKGQPDKGPDGQPQDGEQKDQQAGRQDEPVEPVDLPPDAKQAEYVTLGSLDPESEVRMLVHLTNRGAAIERIALNNPRYGDLEDLEDRSGFFGYLGASDDPQGGMLVGVVGAGTPAAAAGLKPGDTITAVDDVPIKTANEFFAQLKKKIDGDSIKVDIRRDGASADSLTATLAKRPVQIIRPEFESKPLDTLAGGKYDQLSLILTLDQIDNETLGDDDAELGDVALRDSLWRITKANELEVEFTKSLPKRNLSVVKRYRLAKVDEEGQPPAGYHLLLDVEFINHGQDKKQIAYRLDGPTGLPTEGWWYSHRFGRQWFVRGLRDVAMHLEQDGAQLIAISEIVSALEKEEPQQIPLKQDGDRTNLLGYAGLDAQYFAVIVLPHRPTIQDQLFAAVEPIRVGEIPKDSKKRNLTNVTVRLTSQPQAVAPGPDARMRQTFTVFAGPKAPRTLQQYQPEAFPAVVTLKELIYYGWGIWGVFARPLSAILHFFYDNVVSNYGVAIILLTIVVRLCMFPLSRKQALGAQKMQELQPEMKRISEKYKGDMEKRSRAIQEMYKKHNYNPLAGCLPMFIQLPIFIGLYRALIVDVELRQAPLISESVRWANNLGAPDMLWYWKPYLPGFLAAETGWLGPYLNILPLITVVLFVWQQKMFMPPPADEQAAMQQKMMQYMMIFFAFLFFKVASGLCIYFIASSLWGIGERMILPKPPPKADETMEVRSTNKPVKDPDNKNTSARSTSSKRKKKKNKKKKRK